MVYAVIPFVSLKLLFCWSSCTNWAGSWQEAYLNLSCTVFGPFFLPFCHNTSTVTDVVSLVRLVTMSFLSHCASIFVSNTIGVMQHHAFFSQQLRLVELYNWYVYWSFENMHTPCCWLCSVCTCLLWLVLLGAVALAEFIAETVKLIRLDLRGNYIRTGGLMALMLSLKVNQSVTRIDLDGEPKKEAVRHFKITCHFLACSLIHNTRILM